MTPRALFLALCALFSLAAAAQLPRNEVSVSAGWTEFAQIGGARAIGASYSHFLIPAFSAELGAFRAGDQVSFTDVHAAAEVHALREHLLSPWAAVGLAFAAYDEPPRSESMLTMITGAGVDVKLSRQFAIGAEWHYEAFEVNPRDRFPLRRNPATVMLAARWRY